MKLLYATLIGLVLIASRQTPAIAENSITIAAQEMPGLLEAGKPLPYNQLLDLLLENADQSINVEILPGYRGPRRWLRREYDCIFGGVSGPGHSLPPNTRITEADWYSLHISRPFNTLKVHAFGGPRSEPVHKIEDLAGKQIAVDQVLLFDLRFHTKALGPINIVKVGSASEALNLLLRGRVDQIYAYDNDMALAAGGEMDEFAFDPDFVLLELEESVMCWPGEGIENLIGHVNSKLKNLSESGALRDMLKPPQ
ncbi:MAG: hypothetical protein HWE25_12525 [Alphaproteobacteria bacterium]|nr:hypothetical protein [Alphaproteobacteria bacterium]